MVYIFLSVIEAPGVYEYLKARQIVQQYKKAKRYLLLGKYRIIHFKPREPKTSGIYYFRLTKKYRALGYIDGRVFVVTAIDDHQ